MEHLQLMFRALQFFILRASADDARIVGTFAISLWCVVILGIGILLCVVLVIALLCFAEWLWLKMREEVGR